MSRKEFIPIPPPAPIPEAEAVDVRALLEAYKKGEIDLICVMGPTASGKTHFAVSLARTLNRIIKEEGSGLGSSCPLDHDSGSPDLGLCGAEILSGDSRQIYKGMDIGTGKDLDKYGEIPYHLIDIVPAGHRYDICQYQRDFAAAYADCLKRHVIPILCGGSGLYIEAATKASYIMQDNKDLELCLPQRTFYMATTVDRETRRTRIDRRLKERLDEGMVQEIQSLLNGGVSAESLIFYGLEYKFVTQYILGQLSHEQMFTLLQTAIHQFAKRQMTWLRGMEKDGVKIHWVDALSLD